MSAIETENKKRGEEKKVFLNACEYDGVKFATSKPFARFCCSNCRIASHRDKKKQIIKNIKRGEKRKYNKKIVPIELKNFKQIFIFGSLENAAVRLYAPIEYYIIKDNGDIEMKMKISINSTIKIRLVKWKTKKK